MLSWKHWRRRRRLIQHLERCEAKLASRAATITSMRLEAERKNVRMRAMNLLVSCDGPCNGHDMEHPELVTEDVVWECERIALRLRHWWSRGGVKAREAYLEKWSIPPAPDRALEK